MPTPTGNEDLNGALILGQSICWDETHGYTMGADMNPDTDCSGFIGYCLSHNGFNVPQRWDTSTMIPTLSSYQGFSHTIYDSSMQLVHGDILVWDEYDPDTQRHNGHTFFYAENVTGYIGTSWQTATGQTGLLTRARIEASDDRGHPQNGDQDNGFGCHPEVWVHPFSFNYSDGHTWHLFRWQGATPPPSNLYNMSILSRWIRRRKNML